MTYENEYDSENFVFAAPTIPCLISSPGRESERKSVMGLIDSGADITCVPLQIIEELNLKPVRQAVVMAYDGSTQRRNVYSAHINLPTHESQIIEVVGIEGNGVAIGRQVLNKWKLILNGPQKQLIIE